MFKQFWAPEAEQTINVLTKSWFRCDFVRNTDSIILWCVSWAIIVGMADKSVDQNKKSSAGEEAADKILDPELDIRSDKFNPLKALTSSDFVVPVKNAKIYDNVAQFESAWKRIASGEKPEVKKRNFHAGKCIRFIFSNF